MLAISIQAVPNQSFSLTLDGVRFTLRLKETNGVMVADLDIDGEVILSGTRVLATEPIIPYKALERGNFLLLTDGDTLPDWRQFGVSQSLVYLTPADIVALENG